MSCKLPLRFFFFRWTGTKLTLHKNCMHTCISVVCLCENRNWPSNLYICLGLLLLSFLCYFLIVLGIFDCCAKSCWFFFVVFLGGWGGYCIKCLYCLTAITEISVLGNPTCLCDSSKLWKQLTRILKAGHCYLADKIYRYSF